MNIFSPFELLGLFTLGITITGSILNNRKMILCFPIWVISNIIYLGMHIHLGSWSLALKDAAFIVICVDGYFRWRRK